MIPAQETINKYFEAIKKGDIAGLEIYLKYWPVLLNEKCSEGLTPLHVAIHTKQENVALYLIDKGANYSVVDKFQRLPIHDAAYHGLTKLISELLKQPGVNIDICDMDGRTPLHFAVSSRNLETVQYLVEKCKANPSIEDEDGKTPYNMAVTKKFPEVIQFLSMAVSSSKRSNKRKIIEAQQETTLLAQPKVDLDEAEAVNPYKTKRPSKINKLNLENSKLEEKLKSIEFDINKLKDENFYLLKELGEGVIPIEDTVAKVELDIKAEDQKLSTYSKALGRNKQLYEKLRLKTQEYHKLQEQNTDLHKVIDSIPYAEVVDFEQEYDNVVVAEAIDMPQYFTYPLPSTTLMQPSISPIIEQNFIQLRQTN
jgi:ankyrin repeat protein